METETNENQTITNDRIGKVLQKFLEPGFKAKNDAYLNLFLIRLFGKDGSDKSLSNLTNNKQLQDLFVQWIIDATKLLEKRTVCPQPHLVSFTLRLTSQLSSDEHIFVNLNCRNIFESLVGIAHRSSFKDPSVNYGMVRLLCSFLDHKSGVQWVMATTHWTDIINLGLTSPTMFIRKKAQMFVTKLLEKTICINRNFGVNLVTILLKPIKDILRSLQSINNGQHKQIKNAELFQLLRPSLEFVSNVTTALLKNYNTCVLHLFIEQNTSETIEQIVLFSQNEDVTFELLKIQFVFLFYKLCLKLYGVKMVAHDSVTLYDIQVMFDLIKNEMDKNNVRCVVKICDFAHAMYCSLAPRMPLCVRKGEVIEFQNQMLLFQLMPILIFNAKIICGGCHPRKLYMNDDFRKMFIQKLLKMAAIRSLELCYRWKETLALKPDLLEDAAFSLHHLAKIKHLLNKERASTLFTPLVYVLKDTLTVIATMINIECAPGYTNFICALVDTMVDLVETFDLTWKESIEMIRVMDLAMEFLNYPHWTETVIIIKGLKLLNTAISRYMCPDMVLLMYNTEDSTIRQTGTLLHEKCRDSVWEIRDSALEVIYTLTLNANTKFPALTDVLLAAKLPQLVVDMAFHDEQYCVKTTAIRCLQEFIELSDIRDLMLGVDKFLDNVVGIVENGTEAVVRREAAKLVHRIYKHEGFPDKMLPRLYDVMTHAAIGDSHWEVKYNALDFWFEMWKLYLKNQGMIDKIFPTHTFSKEHKKIITLNEAEVRKRIIKVLNQLGNAGCLHVMKCAALDHRDVEVSKRVITAGCKVVHLFEKYKVPQDNVDVAESPRSSTAHNDRLYPYNFEPVSPASSTTLTAFSPVGSPEYFNPLSPFAAQFDPTLDASQIAPPSNSTAYNSSSQDMQYGPQSNQTGCEEGSIHKHENPIQTKRSPGTEHDSLFLGSESMISLNQFDNIFDINMLGSGDESFSNYRLQEVNSNGFDLVKEEKILDDLLNTNDLTLLPNVDNPTNQETSNAIPMKKSYLAPSEYLKFVYEFDFSMKEKTKDPSGMNEFNSLLDDILQEHNVVPDFNNMNYY